MKIDIETIPHTEQPYDTCGNWWEDEGIRYIRVSEMGNEDYEFLVAIHEIIEQALCKKRGILNDQIDSFDIEFEKNRKEGDLSEPGDAELCPYKKEHFFATNVQR
jgi:hypothetical protein